MNARFDKALNQLLGLRSRYEDMRTNNGPMADRASAIQELHRARAEVARLRSIAL